MGGILRTDDISDPAPEKSKIVSLFSGRRFIMDVLYTDMDILDGLYL